MCLFDGDFSVLSLIGPLITKKHKKCALCSNVFDKEKETFCFVHTLFYKFFVSMKEK